MKMRTIIKDQNGATAVEFAIILPLLILLIFGIIEFSLLLYNKQVITNATREGTRLGIIVKNPRIDNDQIREKIKEYAATYLVTFGSDTLEDANIYIASTDDGDPDTPCRPEDWVDIDLTTTTIERCLNFGSELKVFVTYEYEFLVLNNPITQIWGGIGPIKLTATSIMRME